MAHPKRRHSTSRRDKRRTHDSLSTKALSVDATTGEIHVRHRAHIFEGKLVAEGYQKA